MEVIKVLVAFFIIVLLYAWLIEPMLVKVRKEIVQVNPKLLHSGLRIALLSDFHLGAGVFTFVVKTKLAALRRAHAAEPVDLIFLGGDYLDRSIRYLPQLHMVLTEITSLKVPVYGVLGNHDHQHFTKQQEKEVEKVLRKSGVHLLKNEAELVKVGKEEIALVGLDDLMRSPDYGIHKKRHPRAQDYRDRVEKMNWYHPFDNFYQEHLRILLAHNPDSVHMQGATRPHVVLSGHTHGGQFFFIPWFKHLAYKAKLMPPGSYLSWAGRAFLQGTTLIVSRGLGESTLPLRLFVRPEIVVVTLEKAAASEDLIGGPS